MGLAASRQEAFWEACGFGHVNRVKKYLEDGDIDVNWVSYTHDCCPIHVASQGKPEIVQMLLNANCNVNVKDIRGNLPIHHAAMKGHADIIQTLIDNGSEINTQDKNGWTALHCAAYWNYPDAVRVLIQNGADVHIQNKDERTALHETARSPEQNDQKLGEIARMLINAGCDINAKSSDLGEADFTGLMFASYHNHPEVSSAFIEAGCDINAHGTNYWTALHWAADRGNEEMVYLLLESGADPTIKGLRGELAADRAQSSDIKDVLMNAINMWEELNALNKMGVSTDYKLTGSVPSSTKMTPLVTSERNKPDEKYILDNVKIAKDKKNKDVELRMNCKPNNTDHKKPANAEDVDFNQEQVSEVEKESVGKTIKETDTIETLEYKKEEILIKSEDNSINDCGECISLNRTSEKQQDMIQSEKICRTTDSESNFEISDTSSNVEMTCNVSENADCQSVNIGSTDMLSSQLTEDLKIYSENDGDNEVAQESAIERDPKGD